VTVDAPSATHGTAATVTSATSSPSVAPSNERCPLCGTALRADQDWCLQCGAGARTRLAAPPKWKLLVGTLLLILVLALGVLAAALVKLAG
jgi:hypothetical protein